MSIIVDALGFAVMAVFGLIVIVGGIVGACCLLAVLFTVNEREVPL